MNRDILLSSMSSLRGAYNAVGDYLAEYEAMGKVAPKVLVQARSKIATINNELLALPDFNGLRKYIKPAL